MVVIHETDLEEFYSSSTTVLDLSTSSTCFNVLLDELSKSMPDVESKERIRHGFTRHWECPSVAMLAKIIGCEVTIEDARRMLFFPSSKDMSLYPLFIAAITDGDDDDCRMKNVQAPFTALLYMKHVRSWDLMKAFIIADGLHAMVPLLLHSNLYIRSQYVDVIMQITGGSDTFDWFDVTSSKDDPNQILHRKLFSLVGTSFIASLVANRSSVAPGCSFFCLQILAFFLSWVRFHYCKDNILYVSNELLNELRLWKECKMTAVYGDKKEENGASAVPLGSDKEELELISKLYDDFSRYPENLAPDQTHVIVRTTEGTTIDNTNEKSLSIEELKARGDASMKKACFSDAIDWYSRAIVADDTVAAIFGNRALAFFKRLSSGDLESAIADCDNALKLNPRYVKVHFRRAKALFALGRNTDALTSARFALQHDKIGLPEIPKFVIELESKIHSSGDTKPSDSKAEEDPIQVLLNSKKSNTTQKLLIQEMY